MGKYVCKKNEVIDFVYDLGLKNNPYFPDVIFLVLNRKSLVTFLSL